MFFPTKFARVPRRQFSEVSVIKIFDSRFGLFFILGLISLSLENLGTQVAFLFHTQSSQTLALSLSCFLTGLGGGSWWAHRLKTSIEIDRIVERVFLFTALFSGPVLGRFEGLHFMLLSSKEMLGDHFHLVSFLGTAFLYLLLPAVPLGILFPLVSDASIRKSTDEGHTVGSLNVAELTGAVVGSILIGFILIPWMGLARSFWAISLIAMIGYYQHSPGSRRISHFSYAVVLVALFLHQFNTDRAAGIDAPVRVSKEYIVFLEPSPFGNVAVTRKPRHDAGFKKELYISQREMCDSEAWDSERDLARLAMFDWREDDLHVLNIGLGCGFTAQEVLRSNKGAYLDIVEINPVVARATASYFSEENGNILENPRVHLVLRDGIEHLQEGGKKYSRILIDIEEPTIIHSSAFYTKEGFGLVKNRLKEGGIFGLWSVDQKETSKIIWNTLKSVFREVKVFPIAGQVVFLASDNPLVVPPSAQTDRVQSILRTPTMEIATIGKNPYPKYFNINDLFGLPPDKLDPFEIK